MAIGEEFASGTTAGFLHKPSQSNGQSIILTHGAGANCQTPLLVAIAQALQTSGYTVLRYDLPFRQARKSGPPHPSHAGQDREGLRSAVAAMRAMNNGPVLLGGHSYGGRQASILAAEEPDFVQGLLLLSYPLHPPGKPLQLRTSHFGQLQTPLLFIHGDADPFGTVPEMELALRQIPVAHYLLTIERAGHDLKRGRFDIQKRVIEPLIQIVPLR